MLRASLFILCAVAFVSLVCADGALAQEKRRVGRITYHSGWVWVTEKGATGVRTRMRPEWESKKVHKGDEIETGQDSCAELTIESTVVQISQNSHVALDVTDEGIYIVKMTKGSVTANIDTSIFHLEVTNQENINTILGEGSSVTVEFMPNTNIVVTSGAGTVHVKNEYGPTLRVYRGQSVVIIYDRGKREYIFHPDISNNVSLGLLPKDADKFEEKLFPGKEYVVFSTGAGAYRDAKIGDEEKSWEKVPPPQREYHVTALIRYDWFEHNQPVWYYQGDNEGFNTTRAVLAVETTYHYAQLYLGADVARTDPLEDLWLALYFPKKKDAFQFKIGQMHLPFGIQAQQYPEELDLIEYSQGITYAFACPKGDPRQYTSDLDYLFDAGAQLCGEFEFAADVNLQYNIGFFNGEKRQTRDTNLQKSSVGRIGLNFNDSFIIGASTYAGRIGSDLDRTSRRKNIDLRINAGDFTLQGEYIWAQDTPEVDNVHYVTEGYYIQMTFGLTLLKETWENWKLVARWDMLDPPRGMVDVGARNRYLKSTMASAGLVWEISDRVKLTILFQVLEQGNDRYLDIDKDNIVDVPPLLEKTDASQRAIFQFNIRF